MNKIDPRGPQPENAGTKNALPLPDALRGGNFDPGTPVPDDFFFQSPDGFFLCIAPNLWAFWSPNSKLKALFSPVYYHDEMYIHFGHDRSGGNGYYLSYSNSGYIGLYGFELSVARSARASR